MYIYTYMYIHTHVYVCIYMCIEEAEATEMRETFLARQRTNVEIKLVCAHSSLSTTPPLCLSLSWICTTTTISKSRGRAIGRVCTM